MYIHIHRYICVYMAMYVGMYVYVGLYAMWIVFAYYVCICNTLNLYHVIVACFINNLVCLTLLGKSFS